LKKALQFKIIIDGVKFIK